MTIYGEALGSSRWQKGDRLKIAAQPVRTSKTGKQYQTASVIENLSGDSTYSIPPNVQPTITTSPNGVVRNINDQFSEKYRLTMSNLIGSYMSGGKIPTESEFQQIDNLVRKVLEAKANSVDEMLSDDAPF